jgi:hypothetical protein
MPAETTPLLELANNLGGTMFSLVACFWYIKYLTDTHKSREEMWIKKDTESDLRLAESHKQLAQLQASSHTELLKVLSDVNDTLKGMTVAISKLETRFDQ